MAFYGLELHLSFSNCRVNAEARGIRVSTHVQLEGKQTFLEISQTETVFDQAEGTFTQHTAIPYRFDTVQLVKFTLLRISGREDEKIQCREGDVHIALPSLVVSPSAVSLLFPSNLSLQVNLRIPATYCDYTRLQFGAAHLKSYNNYPLAAYFIMVLVQERRKMLLYKSEVIRSKDARWNPFKVPTHPLEAADLQIRVYNYNTNGQDTLIGYCSTNYAQLIKGVGPNTYMLMDEGGQRRGEKVKLELLRVDRDTGPSFFDVMRSGCDIRPSVSVDFTASNGNPLQPQSLHYIHPHEPSTYAKSFEKRITPILYHCRDMRISSIGFGAKIPPYFQLSNCFPMLTESETVVGVEGLLQAYRRCCLSIQPFGPTQYADSIYHISKFAKAAINLHMNTFFILHIFTDGVQSVCQRTVDALVDLSPYPIFVFFIGVGKNNNELLPLKRIEAHPLKHSDGRVSARQVCLFVSEEDVEDDGLGLIPFFIAQWKNLAETS